MQFDIHLQRLRHHRDDCAGCAGCDAYKPPPPPLPLLLLLLLQVVGLMFVSHRPPPFCCTSAVSSRARQCLFSSFSPFVGPCDADTLN